MPFVRHVQAAAAVHRDADWESEAGGARAGKSLPVMLDWPYTTPAVVRAGQVAAHVVARIAATARGSGARAATQA